MFTVDFSPKNYENDIAIWELAEPIEMNEYVAAVALPEMMQDSTGECTVSGWGTLHSGRQHQSFTRPYIVLVRDVNEISRIFHNFVDSFTNQAGPAAR